MAERKPTRMHELFNSTGVKPNEKMRLNERLQQPVAPLEEQRSAVTPQQWRFIYELVDGEGKQTMKQAAINAGFPADRASKIAHDLTNPKTNPQIVAAIQKYRQEMAEKYGTNIERHLRDLQQIRDAALAAGNYGAAVTAEYRRGQALGNIYIDRKEIRHGTIDSMSADEVRKKLEEIKALYGGPPPREIIEAEVVEVVEVDSEQVEGLELLQEIRDGEKARKRAAQEAKRESAAGDDNPAGESSWAGDAGLSGSADTAALCDDRAESCGEREAGEVEPSSDSVQSASWESGAASLDSGAVSPEGDAEQEGDKAAPLSREAGTGPF